MYKCADQPVRWHRRCQVFLAVDILKGIINSLSLHGWQRHDISMAVSEFVYLRMHMYGICERYFPADLTSSDDLRGI